MFTSVCLRLSHWPGIPKHTRLAGQQALEFSLHLPALGLKACATAMAFFLRCEFQGWNSNFTLSTEQSPSPVFMVLVDIITLSWKQLIKCSVPIRSRPGVVAPLSQLLWRLRLEVHMLEAGKHSKIMPQNRKIKRSGVWLSARTLTCPARVRLRV